jgi:NCS1 family nucleobase:cation symporter-1
VAVCIDSTLMLIGAIYVVFVANDFLGPFQGFLITLGVPIAAWCGIFVADILLRKADYAEAELFTPGGRYGDVRWTSVGLVVVGSAVGWGLVTNTMASWLDWQGYLLGPIGGKDGDWAFANLGVIVSLAIGFIGYLLLGRGAVRAQERIPAVTGSVVTNAQTEGVS